MPCLRWTWRATVILAVLLLPETASSSMVYDPYTNKTLTGTLDYEYETNNKSYGSSSDTSTSRFTQKYTLDLKGSMWDPKVAVYDAGIKLHTTTSGSDASDDITNDVWNYYLHTMVLRRSRFPLTLRASRVTSESSVEGSEMQTTDTYTIDWLMKFYTFPVTRLGLTRTEESGGAETNAYSLELEKAIGPTRNTLGYNLSDSSSEGSGSQSSTLNFTNTTQVSKKTTFYLGATKNTSEQDSDLATEASDSDTWALNMNISSKPGKDFTQHHSYSMYNGQTGDDDQAGEYYAGAMTWRLGPKLHTSMTLSTNSIESDSPTLDSEEDNLAYAASLGYSITSRLSLSQSFNYEEQESTETDVLTSQSSRKVMSETTALSYSRPIGPFGFSTSYGFGYKKETIEPDPEMRSGAALTQSLGLGLGSERLPLVRFGTSYSLSMDKPTSGGVWSETKTYSAWGSNKFLERYVRLSGSYSRSTTGSWTMTRDTDSENIRFDLSTSYFRRTSIQLYQQFSSYWSTTEGTSDKTMHGLAVRHRRGLFGGPLDLAFDYHSTVNDQDTDSSESTSTSYSAKYGRRILWNLGWNTAFEIEELDADDTTTKDTTLTNIFAYRLRAWTLALELMHRESETNIADTIVEDKLLLKASRSFMRIL